MFKHCRVARNTYNIETKHFHHALAATPSNGIAVDIGASGGIFTVGFESKVAPAGYVYAFEPSATAHDWLVRSARYNRLNNVVLERAAISDFDGDADFFELPSSKDCKWRPEASALQVHADDAKRYKVRVVTLDTYFSGITQKIDVIKIDIEGFEAHAIRGGLKTILKHKPFLAIDIHARIDGEGDTEPEVRQLLNPMGYGFERVGHVLVCQ